jgi:hypothetical protein
MTTLADGDARRGASSRKFRLVLSGIAAAFAAPLGLGLAANLMRGSLCPPDALVCAGYGIWALALAQALPYLAFFAPLLILGVALARPAARALRVLAIYGALFVALIVPLWMFAAASYYGVTPRGIVRRAGPLAPGKLDTWINVALVVADCSSKTLGDSTPVFKLTLVDGAVLDLATADGFVAHYSGISQALAGASFAYNNHGVSEHCPAPYRELFRDKPGTHS